MPITRASRRGAEAVHDLASGRRFTYAQFDERVTRAALWLATAFGVTRGDRVAVLSMNDTDVFELQFACRRLGAIFLPLNWRLAVPELEFIAKDASPVVLIHGVEFADAAREVARLAGVPHTADLANGKPSDYEAGIAAANGALDPPALDLADIWTIMYTSGTTGRPKGAQITYQMCVFNGIQCAMTIGLDGADPQPGVPADLPYRRAERLRQPDLPHRRLQRGDAQLRSRPVPAAAQRSRARAHASAGRADQLPDAGAGAGLRRRRPLAHRLHRRRRRGGAAGADRGIRPQGHQAAAGLGHDRDRAARPAAVGRHGAGARWARRACRRSMCG